MCECSEAYVVLGSRCQDCGHRLDWDGFTDDCEAIIRHEMRTALDGGDDD